MTVTPDDTYALLSSPRRRHLLASLLQTELATAEELATRIAACEAGAAIEEVSEEKRHEVLIALVHNHLPRLADHGVIDYDARSGDVVREDRFENLRPAIEAVAPEIEGDLTVTTR